MKREIEAFAARRKEHQQAFHRTLEALAAAIGKKVRSRKKRDEISGLFEELGSQLDQWMAFQDREWDAMSNNHTGLVFQSLQWKMEKLEAEYAHVRHLLTQFSRLEASLQQTIDSLRDRAEPEQIERLSRIREQLSVVQYSDFERRFRGDESRVRDALNRYLDIFADADDIIDLGCGRGEFLDLLKEKGKTALGVDASESMLSLARDKGLECTRDDIVGFLANREAASCGGIFSAQVIEHMDPDSLNRMVRECHRVLRPHSPIVLETINPMSVYALSRIFFLDVTHQKPIHPEYLRYLLESTGFSEVDVLYVEEPAGLKLETVDSADPLAQPFNTNVDKLNEILFAPPVYAVRGVKK